MKNWEQTEARLLNVARPRATDTYTPVAHRMFIEELQSEIGAAGMEIVEKKYMTSTEGKIMTGEYKLSYGYDPDLRLAIGFRNSYNKQVKAAVFGGANVLICKNGFFTSKVSYERKHTGAVVDELRQNINRVVQASKTAFDDLVSDKERMKHIELHPNLISGLIGGMFIEQELITSTQLNIIKHERFYSENFKGLTAWDLYNWVTESYKQDTHPVLYMKNHVKLRAYMSDKFDLSGRSGMFGDPIRFGARVELMQEA